MNKKGTRSGPRPAVRKKKSRKRKKRRPVLFPLLLILLIVWAGYQVLQVGYKKLDTVFPVLTTYRESISGNGFTVLKEKTVNAGEKGIVIFNAQEGEKVPVGYEIATVNLMKDTSGLKDKLIKIQAALDYKNNVSGPSEKDYVITDRERTIIENIQQFVKEEDFNNLVGAINNLDLNTKHSVNISELSELLDESIEDLEAKKKTLSEKISTNNLNYTADFSGVVSYYLPTTKTDLSFDGNFGKYSYDKLKNLEVNQKYENKVKVEKGEPIFRVIDNLEWYMAVAVHDPKQLPDWKQGLPVSVSLDDGPLLRGNIAEINRKNENSGVLIIQMKEGFEENYKYLSHKAEVIRSSKDAYLIPNSCPVEVDKQVGVYVQDLHGLVKFVPVEILKEVNDSVYIARGDRDDYIKIGNKRVKTVGINDSVVTEPGEVEEKQILK